MVTPKLQLDSVNQAYGTASVNARVINRLETAAQLTLQSAAATAIPGSPSPGQSWWLSPSVTWTGAWAGRGNLIATWWYGWQFMLPYPGLLAYIADEKRIAAYQASRSWTSIATVLHYNMIFQSGFVLQKPLFYTERGAQVAQFRTGLNYTGSGSVDFRLRYFAGAVAGGGNVSPVEMIPGPGFATISDINQGHTVSLIATIPEDSWVYWSPFNAQGTINLVHLELIVNELL
jgi:hypothetical protein